jgi:hypothetical protein
VLGGEVQAVVTRAEKEVVGLLVHGTARPLLLLERSETLMPRKPKRLEQRPHWRNLPIPYIALIKPDGEPDFRVTDEDKRKSVISNRWCQLCGQPLGKVCFFTGGTQAAVANAYYEPAAHLDCLVYAMQVCPFIAGKKEHANLGGIQKEYAEMAVARPVISPEGVRIQVNSDDTFTTVKNPYWVIKKATGYDYAYTPSGTLLLIPRVVRETHPIHAETMSASDWNDVFELLVR